MNDPITLLLHDLSHKDALVRRKALKRLSVIGISFEMKDAVLHSVLQSLKDTSITVLRQAVRTLSSFDLDRVPEELQQTFHNTEDEQLRILIHAAAKRIERNADIKKHGAVEWNTEEYVFSVSDFLSYINELLSGETVSIRGEISGISTFRESLIFFNLKDAAGVVNCWFPRVHQYTWGLEPSEGIEVVVKVKPHVSPKSGRFALRVVEMRLSGAGSLKAALEKLKLRLQEEGLFDPSRKRSLPVFPERIGLITGENSAAYSDFIKVLSARMGGLDIYFAPVRVQGVGSIAEVCGAIHYVNTLPLDVIVLTRGGGSLEDLQSFNSEEVTRAVFSSLIPIVVAVGHEKDWSLSELAADLRASTPSNAAELITPKKDELLSAVSHLQQAVEGSMERMLKDMKHAVFSSVRAIETHIEHQIRGCDHLISSLYIYFHGFLGSFTAKQERFSQGVSILLSHVEKYYTLQRRNYTSLAVLLNSFSPKNILKRGYSVVKFHDRIIKSSKEVAKGDLMEIYPYEGKITGEVRDVIFK